MEKYQYVQEFLIKYCDANYKDEMKISTALALMEEGACWSADELGFGYDYVRPKGYAFIIANSCIEFSRPVLVGEKPLLITWPNAPSSVIFERQYLFSCGQETVAKAASRWCLMDWHTGKILSSKCIDNQDYSTYRTDRVLDVRWKIPTFDLEGEESRFSITVGYSEYDHNMHVNNTRYADYCLNVFTVAELQERWIKSFSVSYLRQGKEGETLRFYRKQTEESVYLVQGVNEKSEIVVQAKIQLARY